MSTKKLNIKTPVKVIPKKIILFAAQLPDGMTVILNDTRNGAEYRITSAAMDDGDNG